MKALKDHNLGKHFPSSLYYEALLDGNSCLICVKVASRLPCLSAGGRAV